MSEFRKARRQIEVSPGESVRIIRELQEISQNELPELTGIPQSTISAIENERVNLGVERAKVLARASAKTGLKEMIARETNTKQLLEGFPELRVRYSLFVRVKGILECHQLAKHQG